MIVNEINNSYASLNNRLQLINKISIFLLGFFSSWWLVLKGMEEIIKYNRTIWITFAIIDVAFLIGVSNLFGNISKTRILNIYRILSLYGLVLLDRFYPELLSISIILFVNIFLFQQSLESLRVRIERTAILSNLYSFDKTVIKTRHHNIVYIQERIRWIISTHIVLLIISSFVLLLVNVFLVLQQILSSTIIQYIGITSITMLIILALFKLYIPLEDDDNEFKTNN